MKAWLLVIVLAIVGCADIAGPGVERVDVPPAVETDWLRNLERQQSRARVGSYRTRDGILLV